MNKHDQEILDTIEAVLNEQPPTTHPPESLEGFSSLLMGAGPKAAPHFQQQLKAQLLQKLASDEPADPRSGSDWQRADSYTMPSRSNLARPATKNQPARRLLQTKTLAALLVVMILAGGLLISLFASSAVNNDSQALLDNGATSESVSSGQPLIKSGGIGRLTEFDIASEQSQSTRSTNSTSSSHNSAPYQLRLPFLMYQMI